MKAVWCSLIASFLLVISSLAQEDENCVTYFEGCKISKGECLCGESKGCTNSYPYADREECEKDMKGQNDPCRKSPCKHGLCVQVKRDGARTFKCDCTASGYYGARCQHSCGEMESGQEDFPQECVEIF